MRTSIPDGEIGGGNVFPEEVPMLRLMTVLGVAAALSVAFPAPGNEKAKVLTLADAVKDFNQRAQRDAIGKDQPALTEDEVVAAIRGWVRKEVPAPDAVYQTYQTIADTKMLPEGEGRLRGLGRPLLKGPCELHFQDRD
jgi:hypothetical protein